MLLVGRTWLHGGVCAKRMRACLWDPGARHGPACSAGARACAAHPGLVRAASILPTLQGVHPSNILAITFTIKASCCIAWRCMVACAVLHGGLHGVAWSPALCVRPARHASAQQRADNALRLLRGALRMRRRPAHALMSRRAGGMTRCTMHPCPPQAAQEMKERLVQKGMPDDDRWRWGVCRQCALMAADCAVYWGLAAVRAVARFHPPADSWPGDALPR